MKYALSIFPTEYAIRIDDLARAAEERGFESLWVPEHTHIPISRRTPFPGGTELPREYSHTLDPFVALSAAAAVTKQTQARHRDLPGGRARPDRTRQGSRQPRPAVRGTVSVRYRRGMERRGDGKSRHRSQDPARPDARADRSDEGDLDSGAAAVPWPLRQLRSDLELSQAGSETPSADPDGRAGDQGAARCDRILRRLDADSGANQGSRPPGLRNYAARPRRPDAIRSRFRSQSSGAAATRKRSNNTSRRARSG